jgi:cephalosporin-C deacetylase-like acetyl esterase
MKTEELFDIGRRSKAVLVFVAFLVIFIAAVIIAHLIQTDFGKVEVSNVYYENYNGKKLRAKLFRPIPASTDNPLPGVVFIHGYQNNRESGDAYNI